MLYTIKLLSLWHVNLPVAVYRYRCMLWKCQEYMNMALPSATTATHCGEVTGTKRVPIPCPGRYRQQTNEDSVSHELIKENTELRQFKKHGITYCSVHIIAFEDDVQWQTIFNENLIS